MGFNTIESLESRRMLSAVAAHVVGSTLKVTGTPRNDSIVVSLKGQTLTVKANKIARTFPAKGVKLIDLRGGGGNDKLQVTAPIAYKLNGGKTTTPVVTGLSPVQTIPTTNTFQASSSTLRLTQPSSSTLCLTQPAGGATATSSSTVTLSGGTLKLSGANSTSSVTILTGGTTCLNSFGGAVIDSGTGTLTINATNTTFANTTNGAILIAGPVAINGGTNTSLRLTPVTQYNVNSLFGVVRASPFSLDYGTIDNGTLTIDRACGNVRLFYQTLPVGPTPRIVFSGDETAWNQSFINIALSNSAAISPGTHSLISFADAAYLPANIGHASFSPDIWLPQYTYNLVLNAANRTLDLVIADKPLDAGASSQIIFNGSPILNTPADPGTGQLVIDGAPGNATGGILVAGGSSLFVGTTQSGNLNLDGVVDPRDAALVLTAGSGTLLINNGTTVATLAPLGTNLNINSQSMPDTPLTIRIGGVPTFGLPSAASLTALYLKPTMTVEFATLPTPGQVPLLTLNGGETVYVDHPLGFTITLAPSASIAPGTYPLVHFADGAFMPGDISGMQFKSDTLPAQYTYTLALNGAARTIDLVVADKTAVDPIVTEAPATDPVVADQPA